MSAAEGERNPLDRVAEEFADRIRRGESPNVEAYAAAHPALADRIRELFPTLLVMEALAPLRETAPEAAAAEPPLDLPPVVGRYRLGREIGRGGMGVVFEATPVEEGADTKGRRVALKVVHRHLSHRLGFLERFLREASIGSRVRHPNVVHTLDAGVHEGADGRELPFLVMEHVEGASLGELATDLGGRVPEPLLRHLARQIAAGLESIHAEGIVHRDLKPSNVMVTPDHLVRIMDLGVARLQDASDQVSSTGQFVGSVRYAAPEQFQAGRQPVGPAADLYSLGITLYELATGRHPFDTDSPYALMAAHLNQVPVSAGRRAPELSPFFSGLLDALLAKEPAARLAGARELVDVLAEGDGGAWWADRQGRLAAGGSRITRPAVRREGTLQGREEALSKLHCAWRGAQDDGGRIVVLRGEAGLGKSRLIDAFADDLEGRPVHVLYGSYPPGGGRGGLSAAVLGALGDSDVGRRLGELLVDTPDLVEPFAAFLQDLPPPGGRVAIEARTVRTLYVHLLKALSRERATVWVVDDLQFAPREDVRVVLDLARATSDERALLVLTSRDELPSPLAEELGRLPGVETVTLAPLERTDAMAVLAGTLGSAPWARLVSERVVEAAGGNPLFLLEMAQEIARERREGGFGAGATPTSAELRRLLVPEAIRDLVEIRLRAVPEGQRPLLDVGALLGFEFDPAVVASALGADLLDVLQTLGALERRTGIIRSAEDHFRFHHHQILEVLRDAMPAGLARAYHARIARVLEVRRGATAGGADDEPSAAVAQLAVHALRGGDARLGQRFVAPALAYLTARHAVREVLDLCDLALATEPAPGPDLRAQVLHRRVRASSTLGLRDEYVESVHALLEASRAAADPELLARAYREQGELATNEGDPTAARDWLQRALALARELGATGIEQVTRLALAAQCASQGEFRAAVAHDAEARRLARAEGNAVGEARALLSMAGHSTFLGAYTDALGHLEAGLALVAPGAVQGWRLRTRAFGMRGNVCYALGRYEEAKASYEASLDLAQRIGDREFTAVNLDNLGGTLLALGRLGDAVSSLEQAVGLAAGTAGRVKATGTIANLGSACLAVGDLETASRHLHRALEATHAHGIRRLEGYVLHDLAVLKACRGDVAAALEDARGSLAVRETRGREGLAASLLLIGSLLVRLERPVEARTSFDAARQAADGTGEAVLGTRAALWLAALGKEQESAMAAPESPACFDAIEMHLLRHRVGARASGHLAEARRIFETAATTLPNGRARDAWLTQSPTALLFELLA